MNEPNETNETNEIPKDWWVPIDSDEAWIRQQVFDYERELYELREWWVRPQQLTRQLELQLDEPKQPRPYAPF
jgi:hypothetical protein